MAAKIESNKDICNVSAETANKVMAPKMAWGKIEAPIETASLSDVMSEQLASEMYEKQVIEKKKKEIIDENLAKALQDEESIINESFEGKTAIILSDETHIENQNVANNVTNLEYTESLIENKKPDTNDDFLIAQMLQNQYDNEYDTVITNEENAYNRNSKIKVSYEKFKVMQSNHPVWDDSDDEDPELLAYLNMDDRKRDWDFFEAADKETLPIPRYHIDKNYLLTSRVYCTCFLFFRNYI